MTTQSRPPATALLRARVRAALLYRATPSLGTRPPDGLAALNAFVPPKERRGLVFIDPPFESTDEFALAGDTLNSALRKWSTGIYAFWYPIKGRSQISKFRRMLVEEAPTFCTEFLAYAKTQDELTGSGLVVFNPRWQFDKDVNAICRALVPIFEDSGSGFSTDWWTRPH